MAKKKSLKQPEKGWGRNRSYPRFPVLVQDHDVDAMWVLAANGVHYLLNDKPNIQI